MAFKMRNSVIKGSRVHKDQIKVQREGYANLADGRAPSSAFQKSAFKDPGHGDKFTDEHFASGKHRDSALPKHKAAYLKHTPDHNEETKHPLYEKLTEEEKKEYDSLNETEKANVNQNTELHQLKNALGEEGAAEAMAEAAKPFKHTPYSGPPGSKANEMNNRHYAFAHEGGKANAKHKDNVVDAGSELKAKQAVEKLVEEDKQKS